MRRSPQETKETIPENKQDVMHMQEDEKKPSGVVENKEKDNEKKQKQDKDHQGHTIASSGAAGTDAATVEKSEAEKVTMIQNSFYPSHPSQLSHLSLSFRLLKDKQMWLPIKSTSKP